MNKPALLEYVESKYGKWDDPLWIEVLKNQEKVKTWSDFALILCSILEKTYEGRSMLVVPVWVVCKKYLSQLSELGLIYAKASVGTWSYHNHKFVIIAEILEDLKISYR